MQNQQKYNDITYLKEELSENEQVIKFSNYMLNFQKFMALGIILIAAINNNPLILSAISCPIITTIYFKFIKTKYTKTAKTQELEILRLEQPNEFNSKIKEEKEEKIKSFNIKQTKTNTKAINPKIVDNNQQANKLVRKLTKNK